MKTVSRTETIKTEIDSKKLREGETERERETDEGKRKKAKGQG